jgi:hypothetical protein
MDSLSSRLMAAAERHRLIVANYPAFEHEILAQLDTAEGEDRCHECFEPAVACVCATPPASAVRVLLLLPDRPPQCIEVAGRDAIRDVMQADALDDRPYTLVPPLLRLAMDDDFVRKGLAPTMLHPTYRSRYVLCGPLVVFREDADGTLRDLTAADIATATSIYDTHRV